MNITNSVVVLACEILAFWVIVIIAFLLSGPKDVFTTHYWHKKVSKKKLRKKRQTREVREMRVLKEDLENREIATFPLNGAKLQKILQLGIALNQKLTQEDSDNEKAGDHWLCNYRCVWFAIYQIIVATPLASIAAICAIPPLPSATFGFVVSVLCGAWFGYIIVSEKTRAGITRFGEYAGFLDSGLQFRVPIFEQVSRIIVLQNMDYGPGTENKKNAESDVDEVDINGMLGGPSNPASGIFEIILHGAYKARISVRVGIRVRRADRNSWYWWMFEFTNPGEIGETIASTIQSILSTKAREVTPEEDDPAGSVEDKVRRKFRGFVDAVPEITGAIIAALYELTRERLGGLLPISVAITSIELPPEFTQLLVELDEAEIRREVEDKAGHGRANRWSQVCKKVASLAVELSLDPQDILRILDRDTALAIAQQPGGDIDRYIKSAIVPLVEAIGNKTKPK